MFGQAIGDGALTTLVASPFYPLIAWIFRWAIFPTVNIVGTTALNFIRHAPFGFAGRRKHEFRCCG